MTVRDPTRRVEVVQGTPGTGSLPGIGAALPR